MTLKIRYRDENGCKTPLFAALQYSSYIIIGVILLIKPGWNTTGSINFVLLFSGLLLIGWGIMKLDRYFIGVVE